MNFKAEEVDKVGMISQALDLFINTISNSVVQAKPEDRNSLKAVRKTYVDLQLEVENSVEKPKK